LLVGSDNFCHFLLKYSSEIPIQPYTWLRKALCINGLRAKFSRQSELASYMHVQLAIRGFDLPVNARKFTDETEFQKEERL